MKQEIGKGSRLRDAGLRFLSLMLICSLANGSLGPKAVVRPGGQLRQTVNRLDRERVSGGVQSHGVACWCSAASTADAANEDREKRVAHDNEL